MHIHYLSVETRQISDFSQLKEFVSDGRTDGRIDGRKNPHVEMLEHILPVRTKNDAAMK